MKRLKNKITLITGATSGIGEACVHLFAEQGSNVILIARNAKKLSQLKQFIEKKYKVSVHTIVCDLRSQKAIDSLFQKLPLRFRQVDILINNAGMARGLDAVQNLTPAQWNEMIDTNVKGLLAITRKFVPGMIKRKAGHIINVGSTAGHDVYPRGSVYCATKFAVKALSQAFRLDLLEYGIKVSEVDPGMVETNFSMVRFSGDEVRAKNVYKGIKALTAADVAEAILFAAMRPPHVNINEIIVTPLAQASSNFIIRK